MKKYIVARLIGLVLVIMGLLLCIGVYVMLHTAYIEFNEEAYEQIMQVEEILIANDETVQQLQEDMKADFLIRANAAAYMIQYNQDSIYDIEQLDHIVALLQVDEIHLFTPEGEIYSGNIPAYYGFTFESGDQMSFFAPLLDDYDLELAQDVTPNTADGKEMQYVAVWSEDRQHIVQIGIEPLRLMEAMAATELSYIFSRLTHSSNSIFFAVDTASGEVVSSTNLAINGSDLNDLGLPNFGEEDLGVTLNGAIEGETGHVLLLQQSDDIYIGYFQSHSSIYDSTLVSIAILVAIALAVAVPIIAIIYIMLDRVVLHRFLEVEKGIGLIAAGDLEHKMNVTGLPEFEALSNNVNFMVTRVVESSRKFSEIFEHVNVSIAMYECKSDAVIVTGKLAEILQISSNRLKQEFNTPAVFIAFIEEIMAHPYQGERNLYVLSTENGDRFLKIMRYQEGDSDWGLIMDATDEINEKNVIKRERDTDFLTGLYGKRSFFAQLDALSLRQDEVKKAAILMLDLDNLKYVNDTWGHEIGDKFIYAAANVLHRCEYDYKLCSRLSGDEFSMLLYGAQDYSQLEHEIEQIKKRFAQTYIATPAGVDHRVSASIGYALYPEHAQSFNTCIKYADKAMYTAKSRCKGSVEKYEPKEYQSEIK